MPPEDNLGTETSGNTDITSKTLKKEESHKMNESKNKATKRHRQPTESESEMEKNVKYPTSLAPEIEEGNIEYKLKLVEPSETRFEHLVTQLKWRLQEGGGEAFYEIGVEDNGNFVGLNEEECNASLLTLDNMAKRLDAVIKVVKEIPLGADRRAVKVLVRKAPDDQQFLALRVAVLGNVDCGKSTLVAVLSHGELDDGLGKARLNLFKHRHEIESGRTSSISQEIIGFNSDGELQNYSELSTAEEICQNSSKVITFIDVPGHPKYMKTAIGGLLGRSPHFAMLVVNANTGLAGTAKEQLGLALCLQIPIFIVLTKVDCCKSAAVQQHLAVIEQIIKSPGIHKTPILIKDSSDAVLSAERICTDKIVPIFKLSSVSGQGLDLLKEFLNILPPSGSTKIMDSLSNDHPHFQIDHVYTNVPGAGLVVGGLMKKGHIREGDKILTGPFVDSSFAEAEVTSIQRNGVKCRAVKSGQAAAVALKFDDQKIDISKIRKGMVLSSADASPKACSKFEADIKLLYHQREIKQGFLCTINVGTVRQTVELVKLSKGSLKTGEKDSAEFRFISMPECITEGSTLVLRQNATRAIGTVTKVIP